MLPTRQPTRAVARDVVEHGYLLQGTDKDLRRNGPAAENVRLTLAATREVPEHNDHVRRENQQLGQYRMKLEKGGPPFGLRKKRLAQRNHDEPRETQGDKPREKQHQIKSHMMVL